MIEDHPDFTPYHRYRPWIFKLDEEYTTTLNSPQIWFNAKWLTIFMNGKIRIPKDYAWNGCSPKFSFLDLFVFGTPDGIIDTNTMKPKTYHASLVHDALYQYHRWHTISRKDVDKLFYKMLKDADFKLAWLYYIGIRLFGWMWVQRKYNA